MLLALRTSARPTLLPRCVVCARGLCKDASAKDDKWGKQVATKDSAGQIMHDINAGRFEYINDFMNSLTAGPVKLDFAKEGQPMSEKERERDELNEHNLTMIKRSMVIGSLLAFGGCALGWQLTKWYYGIGSMKEFNEVMKERMPKVSGNMEDSAIGRRLKEQSEHSRDAISEDPQLTDWRRTMRAKFNTPEGAAIARQNSILMVRDMTRTAAAGHASTRMCTWRRANRPCPISRQSRVILRRGDDSHTHRCSLCVAGGGARTGAEGAQIAGSGRQWKCRGSDCRRSYRRRRPADVDRTDSHQGRGRTLDAL